MKKGKKSHHVRPPHDKWEVAIGIFKLVKATLLVAASVGLLSLIHKDAREVLTHRIEQLGVDPDNRLIEHALVKLGLFTDKQLALISLGSLLYAALFYCEGFGLLLRKWWSEGFTIIITASFIPLEILEIAQHFTYLKLGVILANFAILIYLVIRVMERSKEEAEEKE